MKKKPTDIFYLWCVTSLTVLARASFFHFFPFVSIKTSIPKQTTSLPDGRAFEQRLRWWRKRSVHRQCASTLFVVFLFQPFSLFLNYLFLKVIIYLTNVKIDAIVREGCNIYEKWLSCSFSQINKCFLLSYTGVCSTLELPLMIVIVNLFKNGKFASH